MKRFAKWTLIIAIIVVPILLFVRVKPSNLHLGYWCGMCIVHSFEIYEINGSNIGIDSISGSNALYPPSELMFQPYISNSSFISKLKVPILLYITSSWTFGQPDAHDQGGLFIGFTSFGSRQWIRIDPVRVPFFLTETYEELSSEINEINEDRP